MACGWPSLSTGPFLSNPLTLPVFLEYLPYRKDDDEGYGTLEHTCISQGAAMRARASIFADSARARACPDREYSAQEQQDAEAVIAWLARHRGRTGKSACSEFLGGFNSIQMR